MRIKIVPKFLLLRHFAIYDASLKRFPEKYLNLIFDNIPDNHQHLCYVCPICTLNWVMIDRNGYHASSEFTEDHFPPESVGGKSKVLVCKKCNSNAGSSFESSLKDKVAQVSFNKRVPNTVIKTSSIITNLKGWHHGALNIDNTGQMAYQVKNKGKQKLPELTAWEKQTNIAGKGWEMKITLKNPSEEKVTKALLKATYLYCFSNWGYDFIYSKTAEMFRSVLDNTSIYPIKVGWIWLDFQTPVHEGPGIPEGLCFIHAPKELQSIVVNLPMVLKENNYGCMLPILIPDPTTDGQNRIKRINQILENNPNQKISFAPITNYLHLKVKDCYNKTWKDLLEKFA